MVRDRTALAIASVLLLAAALLAGGCSGDAPSDPAPPPSAAAKPRRAPRFELADLPVLFRDRLPPATDHLIAERARRDPLADAWPTEAFHDRARPALEGHLRALLDPGGTPGREAFLDGDFEGSTELRPRELESAFEGRVEVLRAARIERELRPRGELERIGRDLREPHGRAPVALEVLFTSIEPSDDGFDSRALARLASDGPRGPRQQVLELRAAWTAAEGAAPRLRSLRLEGYEETAAARALLADVTRSAFGSDPTFEDDILRGIDDRQMRLDRRAGIAFQGMQGLAVGDVDGDGLDDVYACQQVGVPNSLWIRSADGTATNRAARSHVDFLDVTRSALILDIDNDGHQDIVQAIANRLVLAYNDGSCTFKNQLVLTTPGDEQIYSVSAADPDRDGDLDLYACRYALGGVMHGAPAPYHDANNGATNHYWRNEGGRRFADATAESGLGANNHKFSLASIWEDLDEDGDLDLYVANDFGRNNLFLNDGSGRFADAAERAGADDMAAGMGVSCGDYDLDGKIDLYVSNMFSAAGLRIASQPQFMGGAHPELREAYVRHARGNTLLRNLGRGRFADATATARVAFGRWAWGAKFVDLDGDGWEDLYVPNGQTSSRDRTGDLEGYFWRRVVGRSPPGPGSSAAYRDAFAAIQHMVVFDGLPWNGGERNQAFLNLRDGSFADVSAVSGAAFAEDSRAVAVVDWDDDGRPDLLLRGRSAPRLRLLRNALDGGSRFAAFELVGVRCNRDAIGARVVLELDDGRKLQRRIYAGDGYLSQSSKRLLFGLGNARTIRRASIEWPDGTRDAYEDLAVDTRYRIAQGAAALEVVPRTPRAGSALREEPLESRANPSARIPLIVKLPLAPLPLPAFDGKPRQVADFAGAPLFVLLWSGAHGSGDAALRDLAGSLGRFAAAGAAVETLCTDQGLALARSRELARERDLEPRTGYLDGRSAEAFELALLEVIGFFDRIVLPLGLLFDARGQLVVLYLGPIEAETVAADAAALAALDPAQPLTTPLTGGRWLERRTRDFAGLAEICSARGFDELAAWFRGLAEPATPPR
jgi:hypothetical protein